MKYVYTPGSLGLEELQRFCRTLLDQRALFEPVLPVGSYAFGLHVCSEIAPGSYDIAWEEVPGRKCVAYAFGQRSVYVSADCSPFALLNFLRTHGPKVDAERSAGEGLRTKLQDLQQRLKRAADAACPLVPGTSRRLAQRCRCADGMQWFERHCSAGSVEAGSQA